MTAETKPHMRVRSTPTTAHIDARGLTRAARTGAPAGGTIVMTVDDVLTKNERHRLIKIGKRAGMKESDLALQFKAAIAAAARGVFARGPIAVGLWRLEVLAIWPKQRHHDDDLVTAYGDADAPLAMVKDALQAAGVIDNDMRIVCDRTWSHYMKNERRMVVRLTRISPAEHTIAVGQMLTVERAALTQGTGL